MLEHGRHQILVVDDEPEVLTTVCRALERRGFRTERELEGPQALTRLAAAPQGYSLLIADLSMPGMGGMELLTEAKRICPNLPVVIMTGHGSIETAVRAIQQGAFHYVTKPFHLEDIQLLAEKAVEHGSLQNENARLRATLRQRYRLENLLGAHPKFREVMALVERVADSDSNVILQGESGTGKELVARALHFNSRRASGPFVAVNCGAIPEELLESELFGHVRGAFTGAFRSREGRFQAADRGTLFLDEVGEMSPRLQVKLLRVLQERTLTPVGSTESIPIDARLVAATNRNLERQVAEGHFREDLYFRLNVIPIALPPLRERISDLPLLIGHFLAQFNDGGKYNVEGFAPEALRALERYPWPGNLRELQNLVERMVQLHRTGWIEAAFLPAKYRLEGGAEPPVAPPDLELPETGVDMARLLDEFERRLILQALQRSGGEKKKAAELLGMKRTTLVEKLKRKPILPEGSRPE